MKRKRVRFYEFAQKKIEQDVQSEPWMGINDRIWSTGKYILKEGRECQVKEEAKRYSEIDARMSVRSFVNCYGVFCSEEGHHYLVTQRSDGLHASKMGRVSKEALKQMVEALMRQIDIMHASGVYHGDLHTGNFLFTEIPHSPSCKYRVEFIDPATKLGYSNVYIRSVNEFMQDMGHPNLGGHRIELVQKMLDVAVAVTFTVMTVKVEDSQEDRMRLSSELLRQHYGWNICPKLSDWRNLEYRHWAVAKAIAVFLAELATPTDAQDS